MLNIIFSMTRMIFCLGFVHDYDEDSEENVDSPGGRQKNLITAEWVKVTNYDILILRVTYQWHFVFKLG